MFSLRSSTETGRCLRGAPSAALMVKAVFPRSCQPPRMWAFFCKAVFQPSPLAPAFLQCDYPVLLSRSVALSVLSLSLISTHCGVNQEFPMSKLASTKPPWISDSCKKFFVFLQ